MPAITPKLRTAVLIRDGYRCQRCACPIDQEGGNYSIHHRRPRQMGGDRNANLLSNLLALCGSGVTGCHGWIESNREEAYESGFLVRRGHDPAEKPVRRFQRFWAQPGTTWVSLPVKARAISTMSVN